MGGSWILSKCTGKSQRAGCKHDGRPNQDLFLDEEMNNRQTNKGKTVPPHIILFHWRSHPAHALLTDLLKASLRFSGDVYDIVPAQ